MLVRAAAHIHSEWSYDGKWSLDRLAESFSRRGYQVLLMSEHQNGFDENRRLQYRKACLAASNGKILLVPGMEYSDSSNTVHILVWGNVSFVNGNVDIRRLLRHVEDVGGAAVLAHPSRRNAWQLFDDSWKERLIGIEMWNRKMDGWAPSREAARLIEKSGALPFVGLDFHDFRQFFPLAMVLDVQPSVTEASVLASLRGKHCSSQFLGTPAERWSEGFGVRMLRMAERCRRFAAPFVRKLTIRGAPGSRRTNQSERASNEVDHVQGLVQQDGQKDGKVGVCLHRTLH